MKGRHNKSNNYHEKLKMNSFMKYNFLVQIQKKIGNTTKTKTKYMKREKKFPFI